MTNDKHPISWFTERIGKVIVVDNSLDVIREEVEATHYFKLQHAGIRTFRDPHPLTASILTCNVLRCDECGKIGTTEDLDKEVAAKGFEGEGWKRLSNDTINCGCK